MLLLFHSRILHHQSLHPSTTKPQHARVRRCFTPHHLRLSLYLFSQKRRAFHLLSRSRDRWQNCQLLHLLAHLHLPKRAFLARTALSFTHHPQATKTMRRLQQERSLASLPHHRPRQHSDPSSAAPPHSALGRMTMTGKNHCTLRTLTQNTIPTTINPWRPLRLTAVPFEWRV